ncbi:MAG: alpha/beta hydrolase [Dehalococcoidia bacterium]
MKKRTTVFALAGIAAGAALLRRGGLREDLEWQELEKPGHIIDIDGYGVHIVEQGVGRAIVFIHGFGGQTFQYRHQLPYFARNHRVIAVDLKGFGYSERDANAGLSHTDQVAMLHSLLERLGIDHAVIVGHSMGGAVAQRFAAGHPAMVDALVLVAAMPADRRPRRAPLPAFALLPVLPLLARVAASRLLKYGFHDAANLTQEVREEYLRPARIKGSMYGLTKMMQDARSDLAVDLSRVTMPILLLYGAHDPVAPLSMAQQIRARIPRARLTVIERAAHLLLEERPDECNRAIGHFLRESVPAATTRA